MGSNFSLSGDEDAGDWAPECDGVAGPLMSVGEETAESLREREPGTSIKES